MSVVIPEELRAWACAGCGARWGQSLPSRCPGCDEAAGCRPVYKTTAEVKADKANQNERPDG